MIARGSRSLGGLAASAAMFATGCDLHWPEPASPEAGDVILLVHASAMSPATPGKMSNVSIYEFGPNPDEREPGNRRVITGKRIRFRVDHSMVDVTNRRSGPHFSLQLNYDIKTLGPSSRGIPNGVAATLGGSPRGRRLTPANIGSSDGGFGAIGSLSPGALHRRDDLVCGMHAYDVSSPGTTERGMERYEEHPLGLQLVERFGGSMVFAVPAIGGAYSDVISCSRRLPTCSAETSYRGWPVRIIFGNQHVCEYDRIASSTRTLFDRFYIDENERSPGQDNRLWQSAPAR